MAIVTVVCTPGGASDNSYVSSTDADTYFASTLREPDWEGHNEDDRSRALIQATQNVERLGGIQGDPDSPDRALFAGAPHTADTQVLHFPRSSDVDDSLAVVIPQDLADAVCEQAIWLLEEQTNPSLVDRDALRSAGVRSFSADGLSEQYGVSTIPKGIAPLAWSLVSPFVTRVFRTVTA